MTFFADSSAFYAAADIGDRNHGRAVLILSRPEPLVTTDHVVVESWLLIRHRLGRGAAERFWEGVRSGAVVVEPIGLADLEVAWSIGVAFPDQDFSIVDRTSFVAMQRLGIGRVASFDDDFAVFRFGRNREWAFEVLR